MMPSSSKEAISKEENKKETIPKDPFIPLHVNFYKKPYNYIRRQKLILLSQLLYGEKHYMAKSFAEKNTFTQQIETSCFNNAIKYANESSIIPIWESVEFQNIYHAICCKVFRNIRSSVNNDYLMPALFDNKIKTREIGTLRAKDMFPAKYVEINKRIDAMNNHVEDKIRTTNMFMCRKCKCKETTYLHKITRALDEGTSLLVTCTNCHFTWLIGG